jgi:hypothetical protein
LNRSQLIWFAQTAFKRYKVYTIPKRTGGTRRIEHPSRELKAVQRWINKFLFHSFSVHENATAYKKGASILKNAERHVDSSFTLRLDFEDFFPSFSKMSISLFLENQNTIRELGLSKEDIAFVCNIATRHESLTVGAPSSPVITNVMMYKFDEIISDLARQNRLSYTRYADDIFVSTKNPDSLKGIADKIANISKNYEHVSLSINHGKTAYLSRRYNRSITCLVITPDHKVSIGRARKREIKSMVHNFMNGELDGESLSRLRGLVAFAMDAELTFFQSLKNKYGEAVLERVLGRIE